MNFKRNLLILSAILIGVLIVVIGCLPTTPPAEEGDVPSGGSISIAGGAVTTNDTTPPLTISATGADYMAFSGNGTTWSSWVTYATAYSTFNITTGVGCTSGDGTKTVYVKFKNDDGESTKTYDTIVLDTVKPTLLTAVYTDVGSGGTVNKSDTIVFTFDDEMDITTVTASTVKANLLLSGSKSYGTSPTVSWDSTLKICTVTLGASPTLVVGTTTVNPSSSVTDTAGNADASTAVIISGLPTTGVLASVTAYNASATIGGSDVQLTAIAKDGAGTNITSLCDLTWTKISGIGSITTAGLYSPPGSGSAGSATVKVSAVKTGTTTPVKTAYATVTINPAAAPSTDPDAAKLSINASTGSFKATYTDVPEGATVKVYSYVSNSPTDAVEEGVKSVITIDNEPAACTDIADDHFIFFRIFYSNDSESATTSDGRMPSAPDLEGALAAIQAINKNTVTSTAAGTVGADDKITLYVDTEPYSVPTTVGESMTFTLDLVANNEPKYTRTNANGHESKLSVADGKILSPTAADHNEGTINELEANDTIILTFGETVIVTADITLSYISWISDGGTSKFGNESDILKGEDAADSTGVVLVAGAVADIGDAETVTFNILSTIPIVDHTGGNRVLPLADDKTFDSNSF